MVVSVEEKGSARPCQVGTKKVSDQRTNVSIERFLEGVEIRVSVVLQDKSGGWPCGRAAQLASGGEWGTSLVCAVS